MQTFDAEGLTVRLVGGDDGEGGGGGPLVVFFHGFGAPGFDLVPLADYLPVAGATGGKARFAFPEAPIDLGPMYGGGRAWWRLDPMKLQQAMLTGVPRDLRDEDPEALPALRELVDGALDHLVERCAPSRLVLGGFSQGAMLATEMALSTERPLDGLVLWSGAFLAGERWTGAMPTRAGLKVLQSHGQVDPLLSFEGAERLRDALVNAGLEVGFHAFRGAHEIPPVVLKATVDFLSARLR